MLKQECWESCVLLSDEIKMVIFPLTQGLQGLSAARQARDSNGLCVH